MARELRTFHVTVPAGTAVGNPQRSNLSFPPREVRELQILIPPGPRGNLGFQIAQAGNQVFPSEPGAFFITDDEKIVWPIENANTSGAWQVIAYNLGSFDHTIEVRFLVDLPAAQAAQVAGGEIGAPIDPVELIPEPPPDGAGAELPPGTLPEPPPSQPREVPVRPSPPAVPGPQAPDLPREPGLPAAPAPPPVRAPGTAEAAYNQGEANTQALLEGRAAQANLEALLNELEARDQALHESALGSQPTPHSTPPPAPIIL